MTNQHSSSTFNDSSNIKAIDTAYEGHLFRSRLEARWAVFFDCLKLRWEYEPEGFKLPDGTHYLPDFRVHSPHGGFAWIEIKPMHVNESEKVKLFRDTLRDDWRRGKAPGYRYTHLMRGSPLEILKEGAHFCPRCGMISTYTDLQRDEAMFLCYECDNETPCGGGHEPEATGIWRTEWYPHKGWICQSKDEFSRWTSCVISAAEIAQQARFEHEAFAKTKAFRAMHHKLFVRPNQSLAWTPKNYGFT